MSRLSTGEARGLMEAYVAMCAPQQEEFVEEVEQIDEIAVNLGGQAALQAKQKELAQKSAATSQVDAMRAQRFGGVNPVVKAAKGGVQGTLDKTTGKFTPTAKPAAPAPTAAAPKPAATAPKPATAPVAAKPAPTPAAQTGNKAADMATWAKANPKLAAKVTPSGTQMGTGQSTMAKQAAELRALRPVTPSQATAAAPSTSAAASGSVAPATAAIASKPVQPAVAPGYQGAKKPFAEDMDAYDVVLEYLLDNGHVDTIDEAHYVMLEMDSEAIQSICEAKYGTAAGRKALAKKIRKGEEVGKSGPGTGFKAVEKAAKKGGARDPKAVAAAAMWKTYGGKKEE